MIPAIHPALFVEADSAEEYSEYRLRAISHPRAPLINIPRASILVAPSYKLRPCSPPLLPPRAWEVETPYSRIRALTPPLEPGPPSMPSAWEGTSVPPKQTLKPASLPRASFATDSISSRETEGRAVSVSTQLPFDIDQHEYIAYRAQALGTPLVPLCSHAEEHVATFEFTSVYCPSSRSLTLDCLLALTTAQIEQRQAESLRALDLQELARPLSSSLSPVGGSPISFRVAPPVSPQDGQPVPAPRRIASLCSAHGPCSAGPTLHLIDILLSFFLSYQRHCLPAHRRNIPGLIRRREFSHLYHNSWDLRPYVTSLQQRHMGSRLFRPQSCRCLRTSRRPAPSSALWLNPASLGSCVGGD